jgi:hypothetical protein
MRSPATQRIRNTGGVWTFFRRKPVPPPAEPPLAGAPQRARLKSYYAQNGDVYKYVDRGDRTSRQTESE